MEKRFAEFNALLRRAGKRTVDSLWWRMGN